VSKALSTFLHPLLKHSAQSGRVHTSLNLNTATGRLSSRNPNLQQQPALEKDGYAIRKAFVAAEGMKLIVADYAQLELRVLAHLTGCKSLIEALSGDGDIHSRTARDMSKDIQEAIDSGEIQLEGGDGSLPTVKDKYPNERRFAKTLNFGIVYGMAEHGLSTRLGCSKEEASQKIQDWYKSRPEVKTWHQKVLHEAMEEDEPNVRTLRGRKRVIKELRDRQQRGRKESHQFRAGARQAINSPIQGGAADIVVEAMVKINEHKGLRDLGFFLILQIHDELVLEGPAEHAEEALEIVQETMQSPFLDDVNLEVPLPVDARICDTWAEGK